MGHVLIYTMVSSPTQVPSGWTLERKWINCGVQQAKAARPILVKPWQNATEWLTYGGVWLTSLFASDVTGSGSSLFHTMQYSRLSFRLAYGVIALHWLIYTVRNARRLYMPSKHYVNIPATKQKSTLLLVLWCLPVVWYERTAMHKSLHKQDINT